MGQLQSCCTDPSGEEKKQGAFSDHGLESGSDRRLDAGSSDHLGIGDEHDSHLHLSASHDPNSTKDEQDAQAERLKALREEQARLELIVSTAGRDMVAVRSARGSTGYYDQGFAAALAQHLEETASNKTTYVERLPPPSTSTQSTGGGGQSSSLSVVDVLIQQEWEGIALGRQKGGGIGENPHTYMDHVAESLLASFVPTKEKLFGSVGPMVENLL
mmetsp:Transcript_18472/g.26068  ORF Transcript_18472/g.26068 Transcript_18472/m.26068 type:complete len:216 (-) Transcript_18472:345-992(-)